jgi:hypothetical protein
MPKIVVPVFVEKAPEGARLGDVKVGQAYYDRLAEVDSVAAQDAIKNDGPTADRTVCILVTRVFVGV